MENHRVFWCNECTTVKHAENGPQTCDTCSKQMANIGWFEFEKTFLRNA